MDKCSWLCHQSAKNQSYFETFTKDKIRSEIMVLNIQMKIKDQIKSVNELKCAGEILDFGIVLEL